MKKFFATFFLALIISFPVLAQQVDEEYTCRVGALWGFPGERVTYEVSDSNMAEIVRQRDGQFAVRPKKSGDFCVTAHFQTPRPETKIYLIHAVGVQNSGEVDEQTYQEEVLHFVNIERRKRNLQPLQLSERLSEFAAIRAREVVIFFSHRRPDGSDFHTVNIGKFLEIGENINGGAKNPEQVVQSWMGSPAHRANILYPGYKYMGVAHIFSPNSKYGNYWVQWFGNF